MTARLDDRWSYDGLPLIRLENEHISADLLPTMGGKVLHLVDKAGDRNVLWRNPRVAVRPGPIGANADDYFAGGWDDAFPTGDACTNERGEQLPYMGEVWNLAMRGEVRSAGPDEVAVAFEAETPITPARITRTVSLAAGEPILRVTTRLENVGALPFEFCWGSHVALAIEPGMRLQVPAGHGEVTDAGAGLLGRQGQRYRYPLVDRNEAEPFDVSRVPPASVGAHALHALGSLRGGWAAAGHPRSRRGVALLFDPSLHKCVWQWMAYGGFRGWYHAILEPWTAPQTSLAAARQAGTARRLGPGEALEGQVAAILYSGLTEVDEVTADGTVRGR